MTNEEYLYKKIKDTIDEEYQKYLKSLNIPSKEEWLKMEHKEETKNIKHKFKAGDVIKDKRTEVYGLVRFVFKDTYELDFDGHITHEPIERIDNDFVFYI